MMPLEIDLLVEEIATKVGVDAGLARAILEQESGYNCNAIRYEPDFKYILTAEKFAKSNGITAQTETQLQKMSWGLMQVMGAVFRELGFTRNLIEAIEPKTSILFGCLKLKKLMQQYSSLSDVIASYNAGSPRRDSGGHYFNQKYVDDVTEKWARK